MRTESFNLFGPGAAFHHVGLVVASIDDAAIPNLEKIHDPIQKVRVAFAELHGTVVEFIEPAGADSPVSKSLAKGIKLVHLCFSVPDVAKAIAFAEERGLRQLSLPVPAVAFDGSQIVWLFHPEFGLFELVESPRA